MQRKVRVNLTLELASKATHWSCNIDRIQLCQTHAMGECWTPADSERRVQHCLTWVQHCLNPLLKWLRWKVCSQTYTCTTPWLTRGRKSYDSGRFSIEIQSNFANKKVVEPSHSWTKCTSWILDVTSLGILNYFGKNAVSTTHSSRAGLLEG